jgi:hypothetical protein
MASTSPIRVLRPVPAGQGRGHLDTNLIRSNTIPEAEVRVRGFGATLPGPTKTLLPQSVKSIRACQRHS